MGWWVLTGDFEGCLIPFCDFFELGRRVARYALVGEDIYQIFLEVKSDSWVVASHCGKMKIYYSIPMILDVAMIDL